MPHNPTMQIDEQVWKRVTKRLLLLEELSEFQNENIASLIRAVVIISKRLGSSALSSDPVDVCMVGPNCKPIVLPPGLAEELDSPTYKYAISLLNEAEQKEFHRRVRVAYELRQMRLDREARKRGATSFVSGVKTPPTPLGDATPGSL